MKLQYILEILIICWLFCYWMFTDGDMCTSFNFGEEILIIKVGSPKWALQLFWWVQAFGLL